MTITTAELRAAYGLTATPFTRELPVDKRWPHPVYDQPLADLRQIVDDRMSAALVAPAGTGKTMLLRALVKQLPEARYRVNYVKVAGLSMRDMCCEIAIAIGCAPAGRYNTLLRNIQQHLTEVADQDGKRSIIIIDEAHDMRPEVLAIMRVITNFAMDSRLVVSILLAGQPSLAATLRRDSLIAVSKRLALYATLRPLGRTEAHDYVTHHLQVAGARSDLLDQSAHDALYEIGGGNLRATNHLALTALRLAAGEKSAVVEATHVAAARERLAP